MGPRISQARPANICSLNGLAAPEWLSEGIAPIPPRSVLSVKNPLWLNLKRQTLVSVAAGSEHPHVVTSPYPGNAQACRREQRR